MFSQQKFDCAMDKAAEYIKSGSVPSAVVGVANGKDILALGSLDGNGEKDASLQDRVFGLASITKTFTGTATACLVDQGVVDFTDPICKHIPEFDNDERRRKIRIGDIFTHSTGLAGLEYDEICGLDILPEDAYKIFLDCDFVYEPGTRSAYRTTTYQILNEIVFRKTGKRMEEFYAEAIFAPCGMTDTSFTPDLEKVLPVVNHPMKAKEEMDRFCRMQLSGAGLWSTVKDLVSYGQGLLEPGKVISEKAFGLMTAVQSDIPRLNEDGDSRRTWGWCKEPRESFPAMSDTGFYHGGATGTLLWIDPAEDFIFVFLTNHWGCGNDQAFSMANCFYE